MAAYTAIPGDDERPSQSLDQATSSLIREEVRALMRQELQAMRAAPAPASTTDEPDGNPPSYDSAAADTSRAAPEEMRSEAARLLSENEPPTDAQPKEPHWFARGFQSLPTGIRFMIIFAPFAAVFVLMPIFCLHGDVLQVTVTAFLMVLANPFIFAIACLISYVFGGVDDSDGKGGRDAAKKGRTNEAGAMLMTSYWFLTWAAFSWIMWAQYESGDRTMVQRYLLAGRFDAKITQHRALETVTLCIETMIPHRNATIDDFTVCFRKMGMPQTIVP